jgi:hypothetical protein
MRTTKERPGARGLVWRVAECWEHEELQSPESESTPRSIARTIDETSAVLSPIVAILIAAVLLGEPIEPAVIAGTALVIVGVWLGALRSTTPG